ncbi:hypothetical protein ACTXG7_27530 [Mycolicibacterium sp. Dal123E01]|uniref:hypothetical protein n=1 Tax=Mycolicibacterium sp. Dal123E01 TaxID=3457578 RepID=UPI00403E9D5E
MKSSLVGPPTRSVISAAVGLGVGYLIWIGSTAIVIVTTPVKYWAIVDAVLLAVFTFGSALLAVFYRNTPKAMAFWLAPVLPILAALYILIVFVT